jgi:hypothetical protein
MALSKTTQDHDTIRNWAESRGAVPAEVASTAKGKQTGILRFAFPKARNNKDENLQEISWDEFFDKFDQNGLQLIYQEKTAAGARSNFNKLIYPEDEHASGRSTSSGRGSSTHSRSAGSSNSGRSSTNRSASASSKSSGRSGATSRTTTAGARSGRSSGTASTSGRKKAA